MEYKPKNSSVVLIHSADKSIKENETEVPAGKLLMVVTYLEMNKSPRAFKSSHRSEQITIMRAHHPNVAFYRYLYNTVGEQWMWYERNLMEDKELESIILNPDVKIYVLYVQGTPAGYCELDCRIQSQVELAYFGLFPEFTGRGLGTYFLKWAIETAWQDSPKRVWVHTCNFDSPYAIRTYQKVGFSAYSQETFLIDDPSVSGC